MFTFDNLFNQALTDRETKGLLRGRGYGLKPGEKDFFSNDYLGLACHTPQMMDNMWRWAEIYGTGSTGSPLVSGRYAGLTTIEKKIAHLKHMEDARIFSSGWQAIASLVPVFTRLFHLSQLKNFVIIADKSMHASFYYSCQAAGVLPQRFRHNDMTHLEKVLEKTKKSYQIIFTESVFSMDGDVCPIHQLWQLSRKYHAYLCVDDAHATGILGKNGQGYAQGHADIVIGTFGKALGVMGAFISGTHNFCRLLDNFSSGYIYSTAISPAVLGAVNRALSIIPSMGEQRDYVKNLAIYFRQILNDNGIDTERSSTHIVPVVIRDKTQTIKLEKYLRQQGYRVGAIRPPSVPPHSSRLRVTFHAFNNKEDVKQLAHLICNFLNGVKK